MELLGLELSRAIEVLAEAGVAPAVDRAAGRRAPENAVWRVVRVREGGRALVAAAFPPPAAGDADVSPAGEGA
ncbi:MAG: hypothetical protein GX558_02275 [Clostridiales bacterium]|mgnify:FL=1|nr:hypothetical protein [Clostridiales bacterium]